MLFRSLEDNVKRLIPTIGRSLLGTLLCPLRWAGTIGLVFALMARGYIALPMGLTFVYVMIPVLSRVTRDAVVEAIKFLVPEAPPSTWLFDQSGNGHHARPHA